MCVTDAASDINPARIIPVWLPTLRILQTEDCRRKTTIIYGCYQITYNVIVIFKTIICQGLLSFKDSILSVFRWKPYRTSFC